MLVNACAGGTQGFISPDLNVNGVVKSGYTVGLAAGNGVAIVGVTDCNAQPVSTDYLATATPVTLNTTGTRSFGSSAAGTIYVDPNGAPVPAGFAGLKPIQ